MSIFCLILAVLFLIFGGVIIDTTEGEERPDEAVVATLGSSVVLFIIAFAFCGC